MYFIFEHIFLQMQYFYFWVIIYIFIWTRLLIYSCQYKSYLLKIDVYRQRYHKMILITLILATVVFQSSNQDQDKKLQFNKYKKYIEKKLFTATVVKRVYWTFSLNRIIIHANNVILEIKTSGIFLRRLK